MTTPPETKVSKPRTCQRCGYTWTPRKRGPVTRCANVKCRSPYWNTPRKEA